MSEKKRVEIRDNQEYFPFVSIQTDPEFLFDDEDYPEVDKTTVKRWKKVFADWKAVQKEMRKVKEDFDYTQKQKAIQLEEKRHKLFREKLTGDCEVIPVNTNLVEIKKLLQGKIANRDQ
jgi:hypothetical protein